MAEKIGSAIPRMKERMQMYQLPEPEYRTEGMFTVTLKRHGDFEKQKELLLDKIDELLPETRFPDSLSAHEVKLLKLIEADSAITIPKMAEKINLPAITIKRFLKTMQQSHIVERKGSKRAGTWYLKANKKK